MEAIFVTAAAIVVFAFTALAVFLWSAMDFLKTGSFDFRLPMMIGIILLAKMAFDRVKIVLKEHT